MKKGGERSIGALGYDTCRKVHISAIVDRHLERAEKLSGTHLNHGGLAFFVGTHFIGGVAKTHLNYCGFFDLLEGFRIGGKVVQIPFI